MSFAAEGLAAPRQRPAPGAASEELIVLLAAGDRCPAPRLGAGLGRVARRRGRLIHGARGAAAIARARATAALARSRKLFLRTNFAGCVSLLSITEQELGRQIADTDETRSQRAHRLLADVNLWLGVCQWSAGDPQAAAASFVRSAQLPSSPLPDGGLLPPALVRAYRKAVRRPRQQVACRLDAPLTADALLVDGKGPTVRGGALQIAAGTHYVVLGACDDKQPTCKTLRARLGGTRAMRLEARPLGCAVQLPGRPSEQALVHCISHREAADARFVGGVLREASASLALVASVRLRPDRFVLRLLPKRGALSPSGSQGAALAFTRQLSAAFDGGKGARGVTLERAAGLLLSELGDGGKGRTMSPRESKLAGAPPWYRRWWVWAAIGVAAVVTTTLVALSARSDTTRVVFGP
ncbi:MAG: hypothetical protein CSA65_07265 [Proteobacteria bacterium]|nr:MAG: hypothetical protein CSB49_02195 [Pseudomonadota bacterium]PIE17814.1 MAG: hypothetical protein CSA65_07265 [Pseudomonadota bacterium]